MKTYVLIELVKQNLLLFFKKFLKPDNNITATEFKWTGALTWYTTNIENSISSLPRYFRNSFYN